MKKKIKNKCRTALDTATEGEYHRIRTFTSYIYILCTYTEMCTHKKNIHLMPEHRCTFIRATYIRVFEKTANM